MLNRRHLFGLVGGAAAMAALPPLPAPAVVVRSVSDININALAISLILGGMSQIMDPPS